MKIQENIPLAQFTTFKIGGSARFFCIVTSAADLKKSLEFAKEKNVTFFVLGGGSNLLISDEGFHGLVIKMEIKKKMINDQQIITAGAGEMWDDFVAWTLEQGFNGLENLSAIPGTVGATPVQNIGAYGVEAGQFISKVRAFDTHMMKEVEIAGRDCHFGYRNSLFKHEKGRYIITHVDFALKKDGKVNVEYKDLKEYFEKVTEPAPFSRPAKLATQPLRSDKFRSFKSSGSVTPVPTPLHVREAVIDIRWHKLPDWNTWGTAGSFFKNPIITQEKFDQLKAKYPGMPGFRDVGGVKIPLGWILDNVCHLKGVMIGGVGTYEKQALVIVTKPGVKAKEVVDFTHDLMKQVKGATGITIEAEVEWVN
ncbi:MAG TPA: UDP-N-acetylmuramate dehydrogenase [Candidatus Paceibacterota bacterium]|jgi:UDP-N-acetylmuramate dehydrogenase|nr:UDP-N-acetylmuramate dehydrogenase [Candidatus Paceibacterota bacterium]